MRTPWAAIALALALGVAPGLFIAAIWLADLSLAGHIAGTGAILLFTGLFLGLSKGNW